MKKNELITMLNRDLADEHAAIIRYLVHAWMEGEDTPIGASLLSRSTGRDVAFPLAGHDHRSIGWRA